MRAVVFSLPEKQAKKEEWEVWCEMEDGSQTNPLWVGNINPHGDGEDLTCFRVTWDTDWKYYLLTVHLYGTESSYGIYTPNEEAEVSNINDLLDE